MSQQAGRLSASIRTSPLTWKTLLTTASPGPRDVGVILDSSPVIAAPLSSIEHFQKAHNGVRAAYFMNNTHSL